MDQFRCGSQPHLRALLARFLMHKVHDSQRAIAEIEKACSVRKGEGIINSQETDCNLLSTNGHLFGQISEPQQCEEGGAVDEYDTVRKFTEEAVNAFRKAQTSTRSGDRVSTVPFIGEAKTRAHLLHMYLTHSFKDKFQEFWEFISETDDESV